MGENTKILPAGWKMRSRPRPTQEGQLYFIFMSPDFQVFHSRKAMVQHLEDAGTYSKEDMHKRFQYSDYRSGKYQEKEQKKEEEKKRKEEEERKKERQAEEEK